MRVTELARNLGLDAADLMAILDEMGITVMSDASSLQPAQIATILDHPAIAAARTRRKDPEAAKAAAAEFIPTPPSQPATRAPNPNDDGTPSPNTTAPPASASEPASVVSTAPPNAPTASAAPKPPVPPPDPIEHEWKQSAERNPILLWGPPGSGKSTFLAAMMFRQVDEDALDGFDWRIMSVGARAGDYVRSVLQAYKAGGQPHATVVTDAPFRFKIRKYRKERRVLGVLRKEQIRLEADLVLVDPPGELFTVSKMRGRAGQRLLELMEHAGGLLLLIDPTYEDQRRYWTMLVENLSEIIDHLRNKKTQVLDDEQRLRIPTAICITKMDQHQADAHRPAEFLREQIGEAAFSVIENSFSNYTVYACSALGNDFKPENNPRPWGIVDPIRWILEESSQKNQMLTRFGW